MALRTVLESLNSICCRGTPISNLLFLCWKQIHCRCLPPPIFLLHTHQLLLIHHIFNSQEIATHQTHSQTKCITFESNSFAKAFSERSVKSLPDTRVVAISKKSSCVVEEPLGALIIASPMDVCSIEKNILHPVSSDNRYCLRKFVASSVLTERNKDIQCNYRIDPRSELLSVYLAWVSEVTSLMQWSNLKGRGGVKYIYLHETFLVNIIEHFIEDRMRNDGFVIQYHKSESCRVHIIRIELAGVFRLAGEEVP